jgi:hypothetical protein
MVSDTQRGQIQLRNELVLKLTVLFQSTHKAKVTNDELEPLLWHS